MVIILTPTFKKKLEQAFPAFFFCSVVQRGEAIGFSVSQADFERLRLSTTEPFMVRSRGYTFRTAEREWTSAADEASSIISSVNQADAFVLCLGIYLWFNDH